MKYHLHKFRFDCKYTGTHNHTLDEYTESMMGVQALHLHYFSGTCSYNGHTHYYSGFTGLPIKTENGHVHRMEGVVETTNHHDHSFSGYTYEDLAYTSQNVLNKALV